MQCFPYASIRAQFESEGYVCVPGVMESPECLARLNLMLGEKREPLDWSKGHAAASRSYYDFAVIWELVEMVKAVLGPNVVLWGASLVHRNPGDVHSWHTDMESSMPEGRTASIWIGLKGTTPETSLKVLPGSHRLGVTVQEVAARAGVGRMRVTDELVAQWAAERGANAGATVVPMTDGDVLLFDGRLWHGSHNVSPELSRTALLLQYAEAGTRVREVDFSRGISWPLEFKESPMTPCVPVAGDVERGANRLVTPPLLACLPRGVRLTGRVVPLELPLPGGAAPFFSMSQLRGHTHVLADFSCHTSALHPGVSPHPPHQHPEEEILVVLQGEVEIWLPALAGAPQGERQRLRRGEMVYYPAGFYHTLTGVGAAPPQYLMLRWVADPVLERPALGHGRWDVFQHRAAGGGDLLRFEGVTQWLKKLHCHVTVMQPGDGYAAHEDPYDVFILVLEGEVETLGQRVQPHGVVFYAAGEPHGMRNVGTEVATYLVFEFHGSPRADVRLGVDFTTRDAELATAQRLVDASAKEVKRLKKKLAQWQKKEEKRQKAAKKAASKLRWHQKLLSGERWKRRVSRWLGRQEQK